MTPGDLEALCALWQKRLRLQDWEIDVAFARRWQMEEGATCGQCTWILTKKFATIRLLLADDFAPGDAPACETEVTLVHELLHLHFAAFPEPPDSQRDTAQEQVVHILSRALVAGYESGQN